MKAKVRTPIAIVGQVGRNKFKAEVYPLDCLIVCSPEPCGGLLPNHDTEERARIIARQLFIRRPFIPLIFRFWLYVEVQTCFDELFVTKIVGLKRRGRGLYADYEDLTPKEAKKVEPFLQSLRKQFEIQKESQKPEWAKRLVAPPRFPSEVVSTPPPNASH
jgi:hypothetical protein